MVVATKADIGWPFGNIDLLPLVAVCIVDMNLAAVCCVEVPLRIHRHSVAA